jgi:hypothetical protein
VAVDIDWIGNQVCSLTWMRPSLRSETELAVDEGVVELQALAPGRPDECLVILPHQRERPARLENGKHADEPLTDAFALGNLAGQILLFRRLAQVLVGAPGL